MHSKLPSACFEDMFGIVDAVATMELGATFDVREAIWTAST
jgi:hypothetical protein